MKLKVPRVLQQTCTVHWANDGVCNIAISITYEKKNTLFMAKPAVTIASPRDRSCA